MKARLYRSVPILLGLAFALQVGWAALEDASVADEHPHIVAGYLHWKSGHTAGGIANPPLGQLWITLPLHLSGRTYRFADDAFLPLVRLPVILAAMVLAWILWRWGLALGGRRTGLFALGALALEPNLIAHAHLATLDLPVTLGWWATLYLWRCATMDVARWRRPALACALALAMTALTKFTGLFVLPALAIAAVAGVRPGGTLRRAMWVLGGAGLAIIALSYAAYGFDLGVRGFVDGLAGKWQHRDAVHFAYLAGRRSESGFAAYYLAALGLKTPLALLGLAVWGAMRVPRGDRVLLLVPAAVLLLAFTFGRVHIGLRHVLAISPAIVLLAAAGAQGLAARGRFGRFALVALGVATVTGVGRTAPEYLAYFNRIAGGSAGGHCWLLDSNLDWGQDDRRLARLLAGDATWQVNPVLQPARAGRFAINANALHNLQRRGETPYDWLIDWQPTRKVGAAWHLYDLTLQDFEQRARARAADPLAQVAWAEAMAAAGDSTGAGRAFALATSHFGSDPRVAARTARWALDHGDVARAAATIRGVTTIPARGGAATSPNVELQVIAERVRLQSMLYAADSDSARARAGLALGVFLAEVGAWEAAMPWIERAAAALPGDLPAQRAPGVAHARRARFTEARRALEASPLRDELGDEIEACRRWEDAERAVETGTTLEDAILHDLGRTQFEAGRIDAAAATFVAILNHNPRDAPALNYLGEAQVRSKLRIAPERITPRAVRVIF